MGVNLSPPPPLRPAPPSFVAKPRDHTLLEEAICAVTETYLLEPELCYVVRECYLVPFIKCITSNM